MRYRKIITMTHAFRPRYSQLSLEALSRCRGIEEYRIIISCEPIRPAVIEVCRSFQFTKIDVVVNKTRLGCDRGILTALQRGFQKSDFVIHVEDDILLAPDALEFFEYCRDRYERDSNIFSVCAYNRLLQPPNPMKSREISRRPFFHPWGWGTWQDRFKEMAGLWGFRKSGGWWEADGTHHGSIWDQAITRRSRKNRCEVYPYLSLSQNIGREIGENANRSMYDERQIFLPYWAGNLPHLEGAWYERLTEKRLKHLARVLRPPKLTKFALSKKEFIKTTFFGNSTSV